MQYEEELDKAKSDVDKQQAERLAKRARYNDDVNARGFNMEATSETFVKRFMSDEFVVFEPLESSDSTMLSMTDPLNCQDADPNAGCLPNQGLDNDIDFDSEDVGWTETERTPENQHRHDFNLSDIQEEESSVVSNPFDVNFEDSPSRGLPDMFKTPVSNAKMSAQFHWSVEHKAKLMPSELNENFHYDSPDNSSYGANIQKRIDAFWNQPLIHPSPDLVKPKKLKKFGVDGENGSRRSPNFDE